MSARKPRLLFVGAFPPADSKIVGGHVTACRTLLDSSFPQHFDLDLIDSTQISNPPPGPIGRLLVALKRFPVFLWRFEKFRPDVLMIFVATGPSVWEKGVMAWYARLRGVPAVLFPRGGWVLDVAAKHASFRGFIRVAFGGARMIFCQSERWREFAVSVMGVAPERAPVILNWTATPDLMAIGAKRARKASGPLRLVFVGWIENLKGVRTLLEALRGMDVGRDFVVDLVGDGSLTAEATTLAQQWGLSNRVRFRGWLKGAALRQALAESDVFVLPSWEEGLPNAMIEAFAAKLAVVITRVGAVPDVAHDGVNALVVAPKSVEELRTALERVIKDDALRLRLADAGFETARSKFEVESAVERLVAGLELAMSDKHLSAAT